MPEHVGSERQPHQTIQCRATGRRRGHPAARHATEVVAVDALTTRAWPSVSATVLCGVGNAGAGHPETVAAGRRRLPAANLDPRSQDARPRDRLSVVEPRGRPASCTGDDAGFTQDRLALPPTEFGSASETIPGSGRPERGHVPALQIHAALQAIESERGHRLNGRADGDGPAGDARRRRGGSARV